MIPTAHNRGDSSRSNCAGCWPLSKEETNHEAKPAKEIVVKVRNEIGLLNQMCKIIAEKGVNIRGCMEPTND